MKYKDIISQDPDVVSGALVFAGTRVPVQVLIDYLKAGDSVERFQRGFPTVSRKQIEEFLNIAFESVKSEMHEAHSA